MTVPAKEAKRVLAAYEKLEAAVRDHRNTKGHDRCWLDDEKLYNLLPGGAGKAGGLPPTMPFLANCKAFEALRRNPNAPIDSTASDPLTLLGMERTKVEAVTALARFYANQYAWHAQATINADPGKVREIFEKDLAAILTKEER